MKRFIFILFLTSAIVLNASKITNNISDALKAGDAKKVASYFETSVELTIPNKKGVFSKTQAELILKNFFGSNKPTSFTSVKKGTDKNGSYSIGDLTTSKGAYRTYILYKKTGASTKITELKFERK